MSKIVIDIPGQMKLFPLRDNSGRFRTYKRVSWLGPFGQAASKGWAKTGLPSMRRRRRNT